MKDGESKGGDCDEVICAERGEPGGECMDRMRLTE